MSKSARPLREPSERTVAYHEAAHAVAACRLLRGVTIVAVGSQKRGLPAHGFTRFRGGYRHNEWREGKGFRTRVTKENRSRLAEHAFRAMIVSFAGPVAHARQSRKPYADVLDVWGRNDDHQSKLAVAHVVPDCTVGWPVGVSLLGGGCIYLLSKPARIMLDRAQDAARQLVARDWHLIEAVAEKLHRKGRLDGSDPVFRRITRIDGRLTAETSPSGRGSPRAKRRS